MRYTNRIPTTAQLRDHEEQWISSCHQDWGMVLMEVAGRQAAVTALSLLESAPGPVTIICGSGNNGGDGLVVARCLHNAGILVAVYLVESNSPPSRQESKIMKQVLAKLGLQINPASESNLQDISAHFNRSALIIDALLGTGQDRPVEGLYAELIKSMNSSGAPILAVDIPSGINSDTGQVMGIAVRAVATVTFGYLKAGLLNYPGAQLCGQIVLANIGLPDIGNSKPGQADPLWLLSTGNWIRTLLPPRPPDAHKGTFGQVAVIAGSLGMSGASLLSSKSTLRAGAGLCILSTPRSLIEGLPPQEIIYHPLNGTSSGSISISALEQARKEISMASAVVLGPGLSLQEETIDFVQKLIPDINKPCVIDADALNALSRNMDVLPPPENCRNFVLTPHPRELSRLTGATVGEIQANRLEAARCAALRFGCTVVLKGAHSIVADPDGPVCINPTGNSGMATAGSGDVLSGIIGGLMAQGAPPAVAAVVGTYLHGAAGDQAAAQIGNVGLIAGDIMNCVPTVINAIRSGKFPGSDLEKQIFIR